MDTASDSTQIETIDIPLEAKMESLELNEASCSGASTPDNSRKRTLRKRVPQINKTEGKRRVIIKPKKRLSSCTNGVTADISQIYLCKKIKRLAPNLETIFEEPKISKANEVLYTELKKKKRFLVFDPNNQNKIKKRHQRVKKVFGKSILKKKRTSIDILLQKLCDVE